MLRSNQISLAIVKEYMDKKNDDSDKLADVWNSLLDARGIILEKIVSSEVHIHICKWSCRIIANFTNQLI
jgi:hypothetical protein